MTQPFRTFVYMFAMIVVAVLTIFGHELHTAGILSAAGADVVAYVLSATVLMVLAVMMSDLVEWLTAPDDRPYNARLLLIPVAGVAVFGYGMVSEAPPGQEVFSVAAGVALGIIATSEFLVYARPVYDHIQDLEQWLQDRGFEERGVE